MSILFCYLFCLFLFICLNLYLFRSSMEFYSSFRFWLWFWFLFIFVWMLLFLRKFFANTLQYSFSRFSQIAILFRKARSHRLWSFITIISRTIFPLNFIKLDFLLLFGFLFKNSALAYRASFMLTCISHEQYFGWILTNSDWHP